jgi:3-hydroxyisobutyrate dehydrogenase
MGAVMAANLVRAGFDVAVHDRDERRMEWPVSLGARPARNLADTAAEAAAVLLSLPGVPQVEAVALASGGLVDRMERGSALVNLSTVSPGLVRRLDAAARARGIDVVDAPVSGAADGARAGTLVVLVGAELDALERARPFLTPLAGTIVHIGPVGTGSAAKLVTNMLWFVHVVALADALALGALAGIAPETLARAIRQSAGGSWVADHDLPNILCGNDDESFTLELCRKDLSLIAELAAEVGAPVALADAAHARFEAAHARFGPRAGELAVARLSEAAADVSIRGTKEEAWPRR